MLKLVDNINTAFFYVGQILSNKISKNKIGNGLTFDNDGNLTLVNSTSDYQLFTCEMDSDKAPAHSGDPLNRAFCEIKNGFGRVHLDLSIRAIDGRLGTLPSDCPTPKMNLESQCVSGGDIWITTGQREIHASGLRVGTRCIVDLVGVFED